MARALVFLLSFTLMNGALAQSRALLEVEQKTIELYRNVLPSVVNVSNIKIARDFGFKTVEIPQGAGSGFVWDTLGHIVTNFHVVRGGNDFVVTFQNDPKQYHASIVGVEPKKDLAVLKLKEMPGKLVPIRPGTSKDLQVGQMTFAIGSPFGLDHTLTTGIVSATGRKIDGIGGVKIHDMIQTDAAINMGNSGGPLLDSSGSLIGVNTVIFSTSGSSAGLGFAVPVDTVKRVVPQLIQHGKIIRPGLGIAIMPEEARERYGIPPRGVVLAYVDEKSPAAQAGLQGMTQDRRGRVYLGDVIMSVDNKEVNSLDDIFQVLEGYKIGDVVSIKYQRRGKDLEAKVRLQAL